MKTQLPSAVAYEQFIHTIPKAELHLHIEGTLEPELMFAIAQRNQVQLRFKTIDEVRKAYQFGNLQSFLDIYYEGSKVLIQEQDFYDLTWSYLERVSKQGVKHTEIFFDPQSHTSRGIRFETIVTGIHRALEDAHSKLGMTTRLIMCFLRHLSEDDAMQTLIDSLPFKNWIVAVGLDSSEIGNPPSKFATVFKRALSEGYLTVAHAGEEGSADYIWQALDQLKVSRIDHGVRCLEDDNLVQRLAKDRIPLTVCPLSNLKLCVVDSLKHHPLKKLLELNLCVTVNSDDPAYFGGYAAQNYIDIRAALDLTLADIVQLAKNSFEASFLTLQEKERYYVELDNLLVKHNNHNERPSSN